MPIESRIGVPNTNYAAMNPKAPARETSIVDVVNNLEFRIRSCGDEAEDIRRIEAFMDANPQLAPPTSKVQALCHQALIFDEVARCIWHDRLSKGQVDIPSAVAFVVNACFGVELMLKCLISKAGVAPKRSHALDVLFAELPRPWQERIHRFSELLRAQHTGWSLMPPEPFHLRLREFGRAFETYRYFYEDKATLVRRDSLLLVQQTLIVDLGMISEFKPIVERFQRGEGHQPTRHRVPYPGDPGSRN